MKKTYLLEDLCCANCAAAIERGVAKIEGVKSASVSFLTTKLVIEAEEEGYEEVFKQMSTPQISEEIMPGDARWGLGVRVIVKESYPYLPVGAFGWSGAYGSHFWIDPANKIIAVFMKNSKVDGGGGNESARNFEKAVYYSLI